MNKENTAPIKITDIENEIAFKEWLGKHISKFDGNSTPKDSEMIVLLSYILKKSFSSKMANKKVFMRKIKRLQERLKERSSDE